MRIGPKDPLSGVPQEPEGIKQKSSQTEFTAGEVESAETTQGTHSAGSVKSVYSGFADRAQLGGEFIRQTLGDFKGQIPDEDLKAIGDMLSAHVSEDPVVEGKLDRILSLAK